MKHIRESELKQFSEQIKNGELVELLIDVPFSTLVNNNNGIDTLNDYISDCLPLGYYCSNMVYYPKGVSMPDNVACVSISVYCIIECVK